MLFNRCLSQYLTYKDKESSNMFVSFHKKNGHIIKIIQNVNNMLSHYCTFLLLFLLY